MSLFDRMVVSTLPLLPKPLVRRFADPYVAGETLDEAIAAIRSLNELGATATLDLLGEYIGTIEDASRPRDVYIEALGEFKRRSVSSNVSIKLTQLGLEVDPEACYANARAIVLQARETDSFVWIDMEDSRLTSAILGIYRRLRGDFDNVGTVLQSMLRRTLRDVRDLADLKPTIRVCKGIYVEPWQVAYQDDEIINRSYVAAVEAVLDAGGFVGVATHDERLVFEAIRIVGERNLDASRYEFQMLLGVREELRGLILGMGHPLRVYVPYGAEWYAYSVRRMRENPRVAGLVAKAVLGLER